MTQSFTRELVNERSFKNPCIKCKRAVKNGDPCSFCGKQSVKETGGQPTIPIIEEEEEDEEADVQIGTEVGTES